MPSLGLGKMRGGGKGEAAPVITELSPDTLVHDTWTRLTVLGEDFQANDDIVFDDEEYPVELISSGQIKTIASVGVGSEIRAAPVCVKRGALLSNSLSLNII